MAVHGLPYDAVSMLKSLGPVYYIVVLLELGMWVGLVAVGWRKLRRLRTHSPATPVLPA